MSRQILVKDDCFWRLFRLYIPSDSVMRQKLLLELHDNGFASHRGYATTLAKAIDISWWQRIRHDGNDYSHNLSFAVARRSELIWPLILIRYMFRRGLGTP
jgi:hypothetical protein